MVVTSAFVLSLWLSRYVISVVSEAQWKSYILKCMKSQKSNVCYQHIGKCLALVFCRTVFVSWWRVYLLASSCLNWCLVEHSSVKTQSHLLVCPFFYFSSPLTYSLTPPPLPIFPPPPQKYPFWCLQGCLQCLHFLCVCVRVCVCVCVCELFRTLHPLLRSPSRQEFV